MLEPLPKEIPLATKYKGKSISLRADGRWWARYRESGKTISVYASTKKECLEKLKVALKEKRTTTTPLLTVGAWINQWLELYKIGKIKESTLYDYKQLLKYLQPIQEKELAKVTSIELQVLLNNLTSGRSRQKLFALLKDFYNRALKNELVKKNPCNNVEIAKHKKKTSKALSRAEEKRFVKACYTHPNGLQFLLCLFQGLRGGEAKALTIEDIDFDSRTISINKAINDLRQLDTPKSEAGNRVLPLFKNTITALEQLPFRIIKDNRQIYMHFHNICKTAKIEGYTVHSLRHTFATRCAEYSISTKVTQKWLGHTTVDMTLNIYSHVNTDFEFEQRDKFDTHFDTQLISKDTL